MEDRLLSHFSRVRLCATPEMAAHQAPPSVGFSKQEYLSGVPLPSPGRQIKWSGIPVSKNFPQFVVIHMVKGFSIVHEAEVDVFLELNIDI